MQCFHECNTWLSLKLSLLSQFNCKFQWSIDSHEHSMQVQTPIRSHNQHFNCSASSSASCLHHTHTHHWLAARSFNMAYCFACMTPARDKFVRLMRALSFSHWTKEKSLSTEVVFGNAVAIPPHSCRRSGKRPCRQSQAALKNVFSLCNRLQCSAPPNQIAARSWW